MSTRTQVLCALWYEYKGSALAWCQKTFLLYLGWGEKGKRTHFCKTKAAVYPISTEKLTNNCPQNFAIGCMGELAAYSRREEETGVVACVRHNACFQPEYFPLALSKEIAQKRGSL